MPWASPRLGRRHAGRAERAAAVRHGTPGDARSVARRDPHRGQQDRAHAVCALVRVGGPEVERHRAHLEREAAQGEEDRHGEQRRGLAAGRGHVRVDPA